MCAQLLYSSSIALRDEHCRQTRGRAQRVPCRTGDVIASVISDRTGVDVKGSRSIGSSGWSSQMVYTAADGQKFFAKTSRKAAKDMFEGEALGLQAMYGAAPFAFTPACADAPGGPGTLGLLAAAARRIRWRRSALAQFMGQPRYTCQPTSVRGVQAPGRCAYQM